MPPVGGLPSRAEPRPIPSRAAKLHLASGVADKTTALPDEPMAHLPSKRRGLRYNSGAELTATPTAAETAPPQQQKADNVRRLRKAEASAGTAAGNAVACVGRGASRAQRATSAEQRERIT